MPNLRSIAQIAYSGRVKRPPMTVVETRRFRDDTDRMLSAEERAALVMYVATHPEQGDVVPDSGGIRKIRWSRAGMGKCCGARVIYYYHSERMPVFLLAAYAMNEHANLSVRRKMGLSQAGFALKFGFPPATLRNGEQGRSRPDAPTRVLLAVIAKHPEAVEDVLVKSVR